MKIIPDAAKRAFFSKMLSAQKNSPHILFVVGVVGVVGGTVLACRATLKLDKKVDEFKAEIDDVKSESSEIVKSTVNHQRDLAYVYGKHTFELIKLYAVPTGVVVISIAALTKSHTTLSKRNTALMSAYALVSTAYENYRDRVRAEFGAEKELDIYHAATRELASNSDGDTAELVCADADAWSPYAKWFDEGSRYWEKDPEYNRMYVECQQRYLNQLLRTRGHVLLNEAYDALGLDRTKAGCVVGWTISKDGDNYIDFGVYQARNSRFVNGWERNILLDFNVDGVIYDKL